jgi:hypothetical protein
MVGYFCFMKPNYTPIALEPGIHQPGICKIQVAPKEWLDTDVVPDFLTKNVTAPIILITGKSFIDLNFIWPSYEYNEKPKSSKHGSFTEVSLSGAINYTSPDILATLETLEYHELVAVVTDSRRQRRIIGNKEQGLSLTFSNKNANLSNSTNAIEVNMVMEQEGKPPFYGWNLSTSSPSTGGGYYCNIVVEEIDYNVAGDTVINMIPARIKAFGRWPNIDLWNDNGDGTFTKGNMPIDAIGNPPTSFVVRNGGGVGKIILSI